jgi:hypothetical protein
LVKVSVNRFFSSRIETIRNEVEAETQRLRDKTLNTLEEIFKVAAKVARGKIRHQRINEKMVQISLNQRRRWVTVAKQIVIIMNGIASNFDEQETHDQLNKLERLVNEATTMDQPQNKKNNIHPTN